MVEGSCKSCYILTKYRSLKCNTFACNSSLDCSVFTSESFTGWTAGSRIALCKECDDLEKWKENDEKQNAADVGNHANFDCQRQEDSFVFDCASRGFHEYEIVWAARMRHRLSAFFEKSNVFDPYAMTLVRKTKATVTEIQVVGHLPREISRFCKFCCDYGGELSALVRDLKYRRSPIPQGGLEIPITLKVFKGDTPNNVFKKMREFLEKFYVEPDKTPPTESLASDDEGEVL